MRRRLAIAAALMLCVTVAPAKMTVELDEEADFGAFKTYRWTQGVPAAKGGVEKQIVTTVNGQMQERGLQPVDDDTADLDVATFVLTESNVDLWSATVTTVWGGRVGSFQVRDITNGTLVVRVTRGGTQDAVFHAMEQQVVEPGLTSLQIERKVDRIIQKMFKKYPRPKKK